MSVIPRNQPLFDHMAQDYGLTLTTSECDDIEAIVLRMLDRDTNSDAVSSSLTVEALRDAIAKCETESDP
jgi:hypothetical protein